MTQSEKDMQELNLTPAKLAAKQQEIAGITGGPSMTLREVMESEDPKPTRKTRSDAGKPREKKPPTICGKLSRDQISTLEALIAAREDARRAYIEAQQVVEDYKDEITAK